MKPTKTLYRNTSVGIYDNCDWVVRIYAKAKKVNLITVVEPTVKWVGNTGGYAEIKHRICDGQMINLAQSCLDSAELDEGDSNHFSKSELLDEIIYSINGRELL